MTDSQNSAPVCADNKASVTDAHAISPSVTTAGVLSPETPAQTLASTSQLANDAEEPKVPASPAPSAPKKGRPCKTNEQTGKPFYRNRDKRAAQAEYARQKRAEKREALEANDYREAKELGEEEAKRILTESRGVSQRHLAQIYKLAVDAARDAKLTMNRFYWEHGCDAMLRSIAEEYPELREPIEDGEVEGQLIGRADLHAFWDYSVSWRERELTFDKYLQLILDIKTDFFTLNAVCEKDFDVESYASWVEFMPHLDPRKLRPGYTQREMREFLNVSEIKQRLLVASRNSMKSSFSLLWIVQQILICPDLRVLLVSETKPLAREFVRQLRGYFEVGAGGPTRLQYLFPMYMIVEGEGTVTEFRSPMAHLNLTIGVVSSSYESQGFAGMRNDLAVHDDPLSNDSVGTEDQIKKTIAKYDAIQKLAEVASLGSLLICTPWAVNDLSAELQNRAKEAAESGDTNFLACRIDPAFLVKQDAKEKAEKNLLDLVEDDVILRFKRLDWKFLRKEMMSGRAENFKFFRSQNLCSWSHLQDDSARCTFTEEDLRAHTKRIDDFRPEIDMAIIDTVLSIDTAWSVSKYADFSALALTTICRRNLKPIAVVRHVEMGRWKISDLAVQIVTMIHNNPQVTKVVIEKSGSWQSLADEIKKAAMIRSYLLPYIYWKSCNQWTAKAKALRIKSLEGMLANDELFFIDGEYTSATFHQFIGFDGISNNNARKNDAPDAIALGMETFFPRLTETKRSEDATKLEEQAEEARARRANYDRMFGNSFSVPQQTVEPVEERRTGPFGIPGLRTPANFQSPAPKSDGKTPMNFGAIHRLRDHTA